MSTSGTESGLALQCDGIERSFGGLRALKGVSLAIREGEIFGLVGPNGSGKTTMVNVITGFYPPRGRPGAPVRQGHHRHAAASHGAAVGVARTFQNLALFNGMTVLDNILLGRHVHMKPGALRTRCSTGVWAAREEIAHRRVVEEIIDFMQLAGHPRRAGRHHSARAARSASSWRARWWPSRAS